MSAATPQVDALMAKWADDGATRGAAFCELRDLAREMERMLGELDPDLMVDDDTLAAACVLSGISDSQYESLCLAIATLKQNRSDT